MKLKPVIIVKLSRNHKHTERIFFFVNLIYREHGLENLFVWKIVHLEKWNINFVSQLKNRNIKKLRPLPVIVYNLLTLNNFYKWFNPRCVNHMYKQSSSTHVPYKPNPKYYLNSVQLSPTKCFLLKYQTCAMWHRWAFQCF